MWPRWSFDYPVLQGKIVPSYWFWLWLRWMEFQVTYFTYFVNDSTKCVSAQFKLTVFIQLIIRKTRHETACLVAERCTFSHRCWTIKNFTTIVSQISNERINHTFRREKKKLKNSYKMYYTNIFLHHFCMAIWNKFLLHNTFSIQAFREGSWRNMDTNLLYP